MSRSTATDRAEAQETLLRRKLGPLFDWRVPEIEDTVGPFNPAAFDDFDCERNQLLAACEERLQTYTDAQIARLLHRQTDPADQTLHDWRDFGSSEIRNLKDRVPPWFAGGFGHPDYAADFENWCKMPAFSVKETLCLSVGFDPRHLPKGNLNDVMKDSPPFMKELFRFLLARFELLKRQFDPDDLDHRVRPVNLLKWARRVDYQMHPRFEMLLRKYHAPETETVEPGVAATADKREIRMIAQLFAVMAMDSLGYDPTAKRSPIPREIVDLAATKGVTVSEDTVRKYLRMGAERIPTNGEEE